MNHRPSALFATTLAVMLVVAGCKSTSSDSEPSPGKSASAGSASGRPVAGSGTAADPLANQDGLQPGLAPLTSASDKSRARDLITQVKTAKTGPKTGYARDRFGSAWTDSAAGAPMSGNGCDTRNDILARDGSKLTYTDGAKECVIASMTLFNPYKSETIAFTRAQASAIQIDHVIPLSYAWQQGAAKWPDDKRAQLANDPLNLLAVDGPDNASKGDSGPSEWLPPFAGIRCSYAVRFAEVALKYQLAVAEADKAAMLGQCAG